MRRHRRRPKSKWYVSSPLLNSVRGATQTQYGLLASLIAIFMLVTVTLIGTRLANAFGTISPNLP